MEVVEWLKELWDTLLKLFKYFLLVADKLYEFFLSENPDEYFCAWSCRQLIDLLNDGFLLLLEVVASKGEKANTHVAIIMIFKANRGFIFKTDGNASPYLEFKKSYLLDILLLIAWHITLLFSEV